MVWDVAVIVGSLRKDSLTRKFVLAMAAIAPDTLKLRIVEIGALPMYNQDLEGNDPAVVVDFKTAIQKADAVLFATPEYNRSVPGALKNAIDIGSRPYGGSSWSAKPAAIVSVSPGALAAFGANHHLRQSLVFLNMPTMPQPEAYIGNVTQLLGADGRISNTDTAKFIQGFLTSFAAWIEANSVKTKAS